MSWGAKLPVAGEGGMWNPRLLLPSYPMATFAIWQCNHCTERRVWGNVGPEAGQLRAYLKCQVSGRTEPHSFIDVGARWEGKPCSLEER